MKPLKILLIALTLSAPVFADFIRVQAGTGLWSAKASGEARYKGTTNYDLANNFGLDSTESSNYIWAFIKHPVPVLPNVRIEVTKFETEGDVGVVEFNGVSYSSNAKSLLNLDQTDAILYYNILDNTAWITVDLGLNLKTYSGSMKVGTQEADISATLPLFYARGRVSIPATELAIEADTKYIAYDGSSVSDSRVKLDYNFFTSPVLDFAAEVGYRTQSVVLDSSSIDVKADMTISGAFFGVNAKF